MSNLTKVNEFSITEQGNNLRYHRFKNSASKRWK
jgi:hypothetical protein